MPICIHLLKWYGVLQKRIVLYNGGSIVALSSVSSIKGLKSKTAYCASKAALDASVRCMAAELSEKKNPCKFHFKRMGGI